MVHGVWIEKLPTASVSPTALSPSRGTPAVLVRRSSLLMRDSARPCLCESGTNINEPELWVWLFNGIQKCTERLGDAMVAAAES